MACVGSGPCSEFDFVRAMPRRRTIEQCCGPLLALIISSARLETIEESITDTESHDRLMAGFDPHCPAGLLFELCAAHWMDVSFVAGCEAGRHNRRDWFWAATALLRQICSTADWDPKEISNLIAWQRQS